MKSNLSGIIGGVARVLDQEYCEYLTGNTGDMKTIADIGHASKRN
jgi:hypothetical protein